MRILHIFNKYLENTVNWAYNLILNTPNSDVSIASPFFIKTNFYNSGFNYIQYPLQTILEEQKNHSLKDGFWRKLILTLILKVYGGYRQYLIRYLRKNPVDLVHSHFAHVGCQYSALAKELKLPHVVSFYGLDYEYIPFKQPKYQILYKQLFQEADRFICEGRHGAATLKRLGCPAEKIKVVRLGVAVDEVPFFHRKKVPGRLNLIQIASMKKKKGHIYTVKAFSKALLTCPNMTLTLVGNGDQQLIEEIESVIHLDNIKKKVHSSGNIDFNELHSFLKNYDVFIHPSCYTDDRNSEGGAPIVILDAQATGLPVISTEHCDIVDEVIHNRTGLLVKEKQIEDLAESIKYFYHMGQEEYDTFSRNARQHVQENYNIKKNASDLQKIYSDLIDSKSN